MRVLVVEDYQPLADLVAEGLSDQGIAADVAYDGTEAADKLGVNSYDVVVLDRTLPGVPGDTLCRMISGSDGRAMVLMLSGAASPEERVDGLGLGADDYLVKPFHFPELVMRVRALARSPATSQAEGPSRRWGRARLLVPPRPAPGPPARAFGEGAGRTGGAHGRLARLPERRAALGEGLGRERRPFHKDRNGHHRRLRRKLGGPQVIETTVGVGYRLVAPPRGTLIPPALPVPPGAVWHSHDRQLPVLIVSCPFAVARWVVALRRRALRQGVG